MVTLLSTNLLKVMTKLKIVRKFCNALSLGCFAFVLNVKANDYVLIDLYAYNLGGLSIGTNNLFVTFDTYGAGGSAQGMANEFDFLFI